MKQSIIFVSRDSKISLGSSLMRSEQLVRLLAPYLPERYKLEYTTMPTGWGGISQLIWAQKQPKRRIYFFTKSASKALSNSVCDILKEKKSTIIIDLVDRDLLKVDWGLANVYISCSVAQKQYVDNVITSQNNAISALLLHNADIDLYDSKPIAHTAFSSAYFGNPNNVYIPFELRDSIASIVITNKEQMTTASSKLKMYSLHYSVRPPSNEAQYCSRIIYKPFTKGFTAMMCYANILVSRSTPDATYFLGNDYPYLVDSESNDEILNVYERARSGFNGPEWHAALKLVDDARNMISPSKLALQFSRILEMVE